MHKAFRVLSALVASGSAVLFTSVTIAPPAFAVELVAYETDVAAGTIIVATGARRLYLVLGEGRALIYPVGVGRPGRQWAGATYIDGKFVRPNWMPPPEIRAEQPGLPDLIPGGSPSNPMGAAAMTLAGGAYAIHGTNSPDSIGGFVSYGCIRMFNEDIVDLFERVGVGTPVIVMP